MSTTTDQAARAYIQTLLNGQTPNGTTPTADDLGPWGDIAQAIKESFDTKGPQGARRAFDALANNDPALAALIAGDLTEGPIFQPFSLKEFIERPPKEWLINNLIGKQDAAMIFGDAGSGKTFVTIDLIYSAITGRSFAGKFEIPKPLTVAYCAGEGLGGLPGRFLAAGNHYHIWDNEAQARLHLFVDVPQLFEKDVDTTIYQFVREWQGTDRGALDILVIDTLHSATFGADENHARDAGAIIQAIKYAVNQLGCTVLLVHHANKTGKYRGSSAFHGSMDSMIETTHDETANLGMLKCFKQKDAPPFDHLWFRLKGDSTAHSVFAEWLEQEIVSLAREEVTAKERARQRIIEILRKSPGLNQTEIVELLSAEIGRPSVLAALQELETAGEVQTERGPKNSKLYQLAMDLGQ
ncbi:MAG: AAA family ATPase [Anaerolineaceae bacterium]|nr:AAA family ATPase [Anaerolineaceae bacterium]MCB9109560.1 AAA family ATPase [Anaerolineales bacterium]